MTVCARSGLFMLLMKSLFLALAVTSALQAAEPTYEWAFTGGGDKNDKTRGVTVDREGNVFLACETTGDGTFGALQRPTAGGTDFCLIKLSPAGQPQWVRSIGGSKTDRGYGVACDASGNVYVTGHYESADALADGVKLPQAGDYDLFVAKYDRDGKLLWIRSEGGSGYDYGHGIAIDRQGDVVVAGAVGMNAVFDGTGLKNSNRAFFCAKYSPAGELRWVKASTDKLNGSAQGVAVDAAGGIYLGGLASGSGSFAGRTLASATTAALVAKLTPAGEIVWTSLLPGTPSALYHEITCDDQGRVWAAGMFKGSVSVLGETLQTTGEKDSDGFIVHFSADGQARWARHLTSKGTDYCLGVTTDGKGTSYVTGEFSDVATFAGRSLTTHGLTDIFTASFDESGTLRWLSQTGGVKGDNAYTMIHDGRSHLVIAGACMGPAEFGKHQVPPTKGADLHAVKLTAP